MAEKLSRRKLLRKGTQALVASGVSAYATSIAAKEPVVEAAPPSLPKGVDYYEKLGVSTFINAAGTYTVLTASTMPPEVLRMMFSLFAMAVASGLTLINGISLLKLITVPLTPAPVRVMPFVKFTVLLQVALPAHTLMAAFLAAPLTAVLTLV